MKTAGLDLIVEGYMSDFLGIKIKQKLSISVVLTQPHLIDQILEALRLNTKPGQKSATTKDIPAASNKALHKHPDSNLLDRHFEYHSVVGKMLYLKKFNNPRSLRHCINARDFKPIPQFNMTKHSNGLVGIFSQ